MGTLLPRRGERTGSPDEPQVLGLDDEAANETFAALSSETARRVLALIYDEPTTPAEIRDEIGTSLQNVHYHLEKLESADLIESAGTDYSAKGNEMTVYAPTNEALVLVAGEQEDQSLLKRAVSRVLAGIAVLAGGALTFGFIVDRWVTETTTESGGGMGTMTVETADTASEATDSLLSDPAVAFFVGGAFVLAVAGLWWYARNR
ncbi:MAG: ArsR/SmtB family transcription factor [Halorhabdus sp.]